MFITVNPLRDSFKIKIIALTEKIHGENSSQACNIARKLKRFKFKFNELIFMVQSLERELKDKTGIDFAEYDKQFKRIEHKYRFYLKGKDILK